MKYNQIRPNLKTGDIVLFSGNSWASSFIKFFSGSKWSHIGLVVKVDDYDITLVWESTTLTDIPDITTGSPKKGVQTVPLSSRHKTYDGKMAVRHLNTSITATMKSNLCTLRKQLMGRPYEQSEIELASSLLDFGKFDNKEDLSSLFCSELVAESLQCMGIIPDKYPSNEFTPKDFDQGKWIDKIMLPGFSYGNVIDID